MTPWFFLNFITSPMSSIFTVVNKQEIVLFFSILYMAIPLGIIFIFRHHEYLEVLRMVTFSMSSMLILLILIVLLITKKESK